MDSNQKYGGNSTNHQDIYESDGGIAQTNTVAIETEEAVKVAKEMAYGSMGKQTEMVNNVLNMSFRIQQPTSSPTQGTEAAYRRTAIQIEVDTGGGDNFRSTDVLSKLGKPTLKPVIRRYEVSEISGAARTEDIHFTVTKVPRLYLLGQDAMIHLGVNILGVTYIKGVNGNKPVSVFKDLGPDIALQRVNFKTDASSVFCKPRVVPIAIQDDLVQAYGAETAKSVWKSTQFNSYGTQSSQLGRNHQGKGPGLIHLWGDRLLSHSQPTVCAVPYATTGRFDAVVDMASHRLIQQMVQS
eukprot:Em0001g1780a